MGVADVPLLSLVKQKMSFLNARNKVLTENVANADTPSYTARDVKAPDFAAMLGRQNGATKSAPAAMRVSSGRHMVAEGALVAGFRPEEMPDADGSVNGNRVSLESQMMKIAETQTDYQTASGIYRKSLSMLRLAVSGGQSGG